MLPYKFEVFSLDHIVSIIVILFLFIIFLGYNDKIGIKDDSKTFLIVLSVLMIFLLMEIFMKIGLMEKEM